MDFGQGLQGAAGGAALGSAFGPWGTAIGAGVGLLGGLFGGGSSDYQDQLKQLATGYGSRTAPQMGSGVQAGSSSLVNNRAGLIAQLEARARGEGPSAATMQMREAMDRASAAQASAAAGAGGRGVNVGAAYRNAADNTMAIQMRGASDTAVLRAQEQANAENQLGSVIGQGIQADNSVGMFNAQQTNDAARANMLAKLQMYGINDEATLRALMGAMGVAGPGVGTQLLAGGANALPGILQYRQGQAKAPQSGFVPAGLDVNDAGIDMTQARWASPAYQGRNPWGWTSENG